MKRLVIAAALLAAAVPAQAQSRAAWAYVPAPAVAAERPAPLAAPVRRTEGPGMGARVRKGALLGAGLGTVTGLVVMWACGSYCEGNRVAGVAAHVGVGAAAGAAVGASVHAARERR